MITPSILPVAALICTGSQPSASAAVAMQERSLDQMLPAYSLCVAATMPAEAKACVLSPERLGSGTPLKLKPPKAAPCSHVFASNAEVSFIASRYRDELALPLFEEEFSNTGPASFAGRQLLDHPEAPSRNGPRSTYVRMEFENARLGECVARAAPEEVRLWLLASMDGEADAPAAVIEEAGRRCSRELNASFRGGRKSRPIARGYYRLAHAPPSIRWDR